MDCRLPDEDSPRSELIVRPARAEDVRYLADHLRCEDLAEIVAASNMDAYTAIGRGFVESVPRVTVEFRGKPAAMFGVVPTENLESPRAGAIWLLGTDEIDLFKTRFLRESAQWLEFATRNYDVVGNVVDERNSKHVKWLKWLGFKFLRRIPQYGHLGLPFYEFVKVISENCFTCAPRQ